MEENLPPKVNEKPENDLTSPSEINTNLESGLSHEEAISNIEKYGKNELPESPPPSSLELVIAQLKSPLVYVLLAAGGVTLVLREFSDAAIILAAVALNSVLGFLQEKKAGDSLRALKSMLNPEIHVIRSGELLKIPVHGVAIGDLVVLNQGDKVPADGRLIELNRLYISEAVLTGESNPVQKKTDEEVFMGTVVESGRGKMVVQKTGAYTKMGKIAMDVQSKEEETPLGKQLGLFSKQLTLLIIGLLLFLTVVGILVGKDWTEMFITAVALAVSAIPEGLLIALTVILAIGMRRILNRKGYVRHLVSAETLGGVTTICSDKTGTLTYGKMELVDYVGNVDALAKQGILANDQDDPIVIATWNWANNVIKNKSELLTMNSRIDSLPFSSKEKMFVSLHRYEHKKHMIYVNGAPEILLDNSKLDKTSKENLQNKIAELTEKGFRVMGMAKKFVSDEVEELNYDLVRSELEWQGLLIFSDPVRPDVKFAFEKATKAGIRLLVITGDYSNTAMSVMNELGIGIEKDKVLLGTDLAQMSDDELAQWLNNRDTLLFARTNPDQKLKIIRALKQNGEVVAMMGDGVNDAPAVAQADIGVVVGNGTDVAKESADLILLDSSFSTIIAAVEEGRGIFDNLRKVILFLMSDAFQGIILVIMTIIMKLPLPITAAQILWINLVSDGFPYMALTVDPKSKDIMKNPPRNPKEPLINDWMRELMAIISLMGGIFAFAFFFYALYNTNDLTFARSVAFAALGIDSSIYVFSVRTLTKPFWEENVFSNKWLIWAVLGGTVVQLLPYWIPAIGSFVGIVPIGTYWLGIVAMGLVMFLAIEVLKWAFKSRFSIKINKGVAYGSN